MWYYFRTVDRSAGLIILQPVEAAFMGLSFGELSHEADLIVLGRVLNERIIGAGTLGAGLENRTVSAETVFKGVYTESTVGVITESENMEDSPQFKQGESVILFLHNDPVFGDKPSGNDYTVVNFLQGKHELDENRLIRGYNPEIEGMTVTGFEKKVADTLESNSTRASSDADYDHNDTDMKSSDDSDPAGTIRYNFSK